MGISKGAIAVTAILLGTTSLAKAYRGPDLLFDGTGGGPVMGATEIANGLIPASGSSGGVTNTVSVDLGASVGNNTMFFVSIVWNKNNTTTLDGAGGYPTLGGLKVQGKYSLYVGSDNNLNSFIGALNMGGLGGPQDLVFFSAQWSEARYRVYRIDNCRVRNWRYNESVGTAGLTTLPMTLLAGDFVIGTATGHDTGAGNPLVAEADTIIRDLAYTYYHGPSTAMRTQDFTKTAAAGGLQDFTLATDGGTRGRMLGVLALAQPASAPSTPEITEIPIFHEYDSAATTQTYKVDVGDPSPGRYFVIALARHRAGTSGAMGTDVTHTLGGNAFTVINVNSLSGNNRGQFRMGYLHLPAGSGLMDFAVAGGTSAERQIRLFKVEGAVFAQHTTGNVTQAGQLDVLQPAGANDLLIGFGMIRDQTIDNVFAGDPVIQGADILGTYNGGAFKAQATAKTSAGGSDGFSLDATAGSIDKTLHVMRFTPA